MSTFLAGLLRDFRRELRDSDGPLDALCVVWLYAGLVVLTLCMVALVVAVAVDTIL